MDRRIHLVATVVLCFGPRPAWSQAPAANAPAVEPPTSAAAPEWKSMSHAKVRSPLPPQSPMSADLTPQMPPAQWADVPLPPPPSVAGSPVPAAAKATSAAGAAAVTSGAALGATPAGPAPAPQPGAFQPRVYAAPGAKVPAGAEAVGEAQGPGEPKVKFAADQTGAMVSITQDLESDRLRQNWAAQGGQLPAFEANAGMMIMYKDMAELAPGAYMSGVGLNGGIRVSLLNLTPPKYETRDRSWFAFKIGGGIDLGAMGVTISIPVQCYSVMGYTQCVGGPQNASMSSFTLVGTIGVMKAFGSFDSPGDWSGFAIGAEWAPSYQSTTLTMSEGDTAPQTTSSFNASGFALNFESGSMKAMAMKMGKKAHFKVRLFLLPPVGELPMLMTASVGAVWY